MLDELNVVLEKIGNLLNGQPGLVGDIGLAILTVLGVYKIMTAVGLGKMNWGEAGKKLEEMFKNFQWRFDGGNGGNASIIKAVALDGTTIYSHDDGMFEILSGGKYSDITDMLSRRERRKLSKLRGRVVKALTATHKENSAAAVAAQVEKFLSPEESNDGFLPKLINVVDLDKLFSTVRGAKEVKADAPEAKKELGVYPPPVTAFINNKKIEPKAAESRKVVVACPMCRVTRAIVSKGIVAKCPECKVGSSKMSPIMLETTSDPKEFLDSNTFIDIRSGAVFKNYQYPDGKFVVYSWNVPAACLLKLCKQPSETFRDQDQLAVYKELKARGKAVEKANKTADECKKVAEAHKKAADEKVAAVKVAADKNIEAVKSETSKVIEELKKTFEKKPDVPAPAGVEGVPGIVTKLPLAVEVPKKSEYTLYCCPKCRITRALIKNGTNADVVCKEVGCNGEKLVATTGNPEEFVLENGQKLTDYCKANNKTSIRFRNYGSEKGDKFVTVLLPMTKIPVHNGVKMTAKKQPSETIVGYVKKAKKSEKVVTDKSKIAVKYNVGKNNDFTNAWSSTWDFSSNEKTPAWEGIRKAMIGMKVGDVVYVPASGQNGECTVKVVEIL